MWKRQEKNYKLNNIPSTQSHLIVSEGQCLGSKSLCLRRGIRVFEAEAFIFKQSHVLVKQRASSSKQESMSVKRELIRGRKGCFLRSKILGDV